MKRKRIGIRIILGVLGLGFVALAIIWTPLARLFFSDIPRGTLTDFIGSICFNYPELSFAPWFIAAGFIYSSAAIGLPRMKFLWGLCILISLLGIFSFSRGLSGAPRSFVEQVGQEAHEKTQADTFAAAKKNAETASIPTLQLSNLMMYIDEKNEQKRLLAVGALMISLVLLIVSAYGFKQSTTGA